MSKDQLVGGLITAVSIIVIIAYAWILFFTEWTLILLKITAFIAVAGIMGILAWIGYTLATTPPPKPIEEIEEELEKVVSEESGASEGEKK